MGSRCPIPNPNSSESNRGRNTLHRKQTGSTGKVASVEPPDYILANPPAMAFWQKHAPALIAAKRLQPLQADCFAIVSHQPAKLRLLSEPVSAEALLIDTARGPPPNPNVSLLRDPPRDLLPPPRAFGLDAASDARLPSEPPPPQMTVIEQFRARRDKMRVSAEDPDLTTEQRHVLLYGTPEEKQAVIEDVREDRRMFA